MVSTELANMTAVISIDLSDSDDWLFYETGFEQMHPLVEIIEWAESINYIYQKDWFCCKVSNTEYELVFPNEEIKALFLLKWQ